MYKILVVDDEIYNIRLLKEIIEEFIEDVVVIEANDGGQAIRLFEENTVDLIITDYRLPDVNGIELCEKIKGKFSDRTIKTILLTGVSYERLKDSMDSVDAYLLKPYDEDDLINEIKRLMDVRG